MLEHGALQRRAQALEQIAKLLAVLGFKQLVLQAPKGCLRDASHRREHHAKVHVLAHALQRQAIACPDRVRRCCPRRSPPHCLCIPRRRAQNLSLRSVPETMYMFIPACMNRE